MGYIKKLKNNELVGGTDKQTIYPVTSAEAVFEEVIEDGLSNFKSQKFLNNNITGNRINEGTITDYNIAEGTITKEKLTHQVQTMLDEGQKKALTPKGNYNPETEYEALDLVFDPATNSSYVSLVTPNTYPVNEDAEGYEEGKWDKVLDGTAVNTAQATINNKVEYLQTQVEAAIENAELELQRATEDANTAAQTANAAAELAEEDVSAAIDSLGTLISDLIADLGASATALVTDPTDLDGIKPVQNYVIGRAFEKVNDFLTDDLELLLVGKDYPLNKAVVSTDKQMLTITKNIEALNLTLAVSAGDIKTYNNTTILAQKDVKSFLSTDTAGATVSNPVYALGSPTKLLLTINRSTPNISVSFTNGTEIVGGVQTITPSIGYDSVDVANEVYNVLNALPDTGWTFTNNNNGSITADYAATEGHSDYTLSFSENSGITCTTTSAVTETYTRIVMTIGVAAGSINVSFNNSDVQSIVVNPSDNANAVAEAIADAFSEDEKWTISNNENTVIAINDTESNSTATFNIVDGILGVTYTVSKPWTGSNNISYYNGTDWNIPTLAEYAASNVFSSDTIIDEQWLIENATDKNSLAKEIENDEYVLTMHALLMSKHKELLEVEYVVAKAVSSVKGNGGSGGGGGSSSGSASAYSGTLTTGGSDTITCFGSSFGLSSTYTVSGKNWPGILDLFSDYTIQNLSVDGKNNIYHLQCLRDGSRMPSAKAKYAILANSENMKLSSSMSSMNVTYNAFINLANALMSMGITPFIGTSYRPYSGATRDMYFMSSILKDWCKNNNTLFMDAAQYRSIVGIGYNFDKPYNTHLGTRLAPLVAYAYMDGLAGLERPYQSLKTYTKRQNVSVSITDLDNLVFSNNYERAKIFRPASTFSSYGLISAVLPATTRNVKKVKLSFTASVPNIKVYVMSTVSGGTFPSLSEYARFHIDEPISVLPEIGDYYMYNNEPFRIVLVNIEDHEGAFCDIYCTKGSLVEPGDVEISGTLTKTVGNGDLTINFSTYGIASLADSYDDLVYNDTLSHWIEVEPDERGAFVLTNLKASMFIDKVHFLVENVDTGSFTISNLNIEWEASQLKTNFLRTPVPDFTSNLWNTNTELITEPTFGEVGTTQTSWSCITTVDGTSTTSEAVSEETREWQLTKNKSRDTDRIRGVPSGCLSMITVGTNKAISTTVSSSKLPVGKAVLEIQARYWGDDITTGFVNNKETITADTFDWARVIVRLSSGVPMHEYKKPVGVSWRIIRIPIDFIGSAAALPIRIYADRDGVLIARVSLKYI